MFELIRMGLRPNASKSSPTANRVAWKNKARTWANFEHYPVNVGIFSHTCQPLFMSIKMCVYYLPFQSEWPSIVSFNEWFPINERFSINWWLYVLFQKRCFRTSSVLSDRWRWRFIKRFLLTDFPTMLPRSECSSRSHHFIDAWSEDNQQFIGLNVSQIHTRLVIPAKLDLWYLDYVRLREFHFRNCLHSFSRLWKWLASFLWTLSPTPANISRMRSFQLVRLGNGEQSLWKEKSNKSIFKGQHIKDFTQS